MSPILGRIALSLSGGGYRAASFHLGTLEMLDELGLLKDVKILSTVSGGSIAGAAYVSSTADGLSFKDFRDNFHTFLKDTNVIQRSMEALRNTVVSNGTSVMPSLIRSAALVYNAPDLLAGKTFGEVSSKKTGLEEIVINTTELHAGGSFRFVTTTNANVRSGNNRTEIDRAVVNDIRLADAVAASSCFPSGFEPIRFPTDFVWPKDVSEIKALLGDRFDGDIPLMDGGIFDNQGIDSIRNIWSRKEKTIDLFIISDTSARDSERFDFPVKPLAGRVPFWVLRLGAWGLLIGSLLSSIAIFFDAYRLYQANGLGMVQGILLYALPFCFSISVFCLIGLLLRRAKLLMKLARAKTGIELWCYLKHLTIPEVIELMMSRLDSVIEMSTNIFMKRVRSLGFTSVFADLGLREKLVPNLIYDLDNEERWGEEVKAAGVIPNEHIRGVSRRAEKFATNLWFLDADELDNLIHCGRATICFKILKHLLRHKTAEMGVADSPAADLYNRAIGIWNKLNV